MSSSETQVLEILLERKPSPAKLEVLGVYDWPVWRKEPSIFPWKYEVAETCYLRRGRVIVTPASGAPVELARGDLVTFPAGLSCTWEVLETVEKHYDCG